MISIGIPGKYFKRMNASEILEEILFASYYLNIFPEVSDLAKNYINQGNSQLESFEMAYFETLEQMGLLDSRC
jgi:hypothetical protein